MTVRQEESTPIGNHFHDTGILKLFKKIENQVDEFEVDTTDLIGDIDQIIALLKSLKTQVKNVESAYEKLIRQQAIRDSVGGPV